MIIFVGSFFRFLNRRMGKKKKDLVIQRDMLSRLDNNVIYMDDYSPNRNYR